MKQFRIRCSQIGKIMTNSKDGLGLGQGAKTYLDQWIKEQLYGKQKEFTSKYTDKGNAVEQSSLDFIAEQLNYGFLFKNEKRYSNAFMLGTPDCVLTSEIIDAKNSWDCFTFPLFDSEIPDKDYYWQGQGYMSLTNIESYKLVYVLSDLPEDMIYKEASSYCWKNGIELDDAIIKEFTSKLTYGNINPKLKIKVFEFEKNNEDVERIHNQVAKCIDYIKDRTSQLNKINSKTLQL
ncbi:MAG: hypothetical protein ABI851_16015 [Saprospiraceae bacterium]